MFCNFIIDEDPSQPYTVIKVFPYKHLLDEIINHILERKSEVFPSSFNLTGDALEHKIMKLCQDIEYETLIACSWNIN
jgi:hypothetical protein